ncbi:MAG: cysteine peptidase family C39 domain-containing protein [Chloroflexi bacterium]|nr:cysteine peptidase family C39 domain-containing protein [Chloroflexota bacterium]
MQKIEKKNESTGIAALKMLLQHYRVDYYDESIRENLEKAPPDLDLNGHLVNFAEECGFRAREYKNVPFELLVEALDKGIPPMVKGDLGVVRGEEKTGEEGYILVSGYQKNGSKSFYAFGIIDPVLKTKLHFSPEQFCRFWNHTGETVENKEESESRLSSMVLVFPPDREPPF